MRRDTSPLDPRRGALHAILRAHLATFLGGRELAGAPLPRFVVDELEGYLECGVLAHGRKARIDGWGLDAEVAVAAHDRARLEHLCRYLLRPPLAAGRLRLLYDGRVCLELKKPWADRTTHVTMSAESFLARLATLVPRPRANTIAYYGVLAAHAAGRSAIVPCPEGAEVAGDGVGGPPERERARGRRPEDVQGDPVRDGGAAGGRSWCPRAPEAGMNVLVKIL